MLQNCPQNKTRNTLDCDQSSYSSRIVFSLSLMPIEFGQTGISAIRSADPENPTVEPNMKWIGRPLAEIWPFEISQFEVGRRSVLNILLSSYSDLVYSSSLRYALVTLSRPEVPFSHDLRVTDYCRPAVDLLTSNPDLLTFSRPLPNLLSTS